MKIFYLKRKEDETGVSGTGRVAQGFVFDNGKVAITWLSEHPSVTVYDSIGEVHAIHGLKSFIDNFNLQEIAVAKLTPDSPASKLMSQ